MKSAGSPKATLVAALAVLAACLSVVVGSASGASKSAPATTFTYRVAYDLGSLNPYLTSLGATNTFDGFIYGTLISVNGHGQPEAELAKKWTATSTKATFTLQSGVTCSDGTALTANQVAADINWTANPKNASTMLGQYVQANTHATAKNATGTITIVSGKPDAFLLDDLGSVPIVCKAGLANPKLLAVGKSGTGPYEMTAISAGNSYTATLRTGFAWGPGGWKTSLPGVPKKIVAQVVTNDTTAANLLLSGKLNAAGVTGPDESRVEAAKLFKASSYSPAGEFMFNQAAGHPGATFTVRKAIVEALDLPAISKVLSGGQGGQKLTQMLEGDIPNLCPGNTTKGNIPGSNVTDAENLLNQAGWTVGSGGIRTNGTQQLTVSLMYFNSQGQETAAAQLIAAELTAVGINATLNLVDGPAFGSTTSAGTWDMFLASGVWENPSAMVGAFTGANFENKGANLSDTNNATYDALVAKAAKIPGTAGCATWNQAESALVKDLDIVPFYELPTPVFGKGAKFSLVQYPWSIRMT